MHTLTLYSKTELYSPGLSSPIYRPQHARLHWNLYTFWHSLSIPMTTSWLQAVVTLQQDQCDLYRMDFQCISQTLVKVGFLEHIYGIVLFKIPRGLPKVSLPWHLSSLWSVCYCLTAPPTARAHILPLGCTWLTGSHVDSALPLLWT